MHMLNIYLYNIGHKIGQIYTIYAYRRCSTCHVCTMCSIHVKFMYVMYVCMYVCMVATICTINIWYIYILIYIHVHSIYTVYIICGHIYIINELIFFLFFPGRSHRKYVIFLFFTSIYTTTLWCFAFF